MISSYRASFNEHFSEEKYLEFLEKLEKGFVKTADDTNELRDDLRIN